jgi:hypothetical protein
MLMLKTLQPKVVKVIFMNPVRAVKKTQQFSSTKFSMLIFKDIIIIDTEDHIKPYNKKFGVTDC